MGRNKRGYAVLICIILLLLNTEGEGVATTTTRNCVRYNEQVIVHVASHNFGYLERFNQLVQDMVSKSLIPPNLGEMINRQLRIAARDVCKLRTLMKPKPTMKPTPRWVGRIPRRARYTRQAFLGGIIATLGLLEIGRTIEHLLAGEGYGSNFDHYLKKIRRTEQSFNLRMTRLEERIRRLEQLEHAGLVVDEIEAILHIESEEWEDIRTLDEDLRGNSILRQGFEAAEKLFEKRNLTKRTTGDQGLQKIRIHPRLRSVRVKIRPHSVCKWAVLTATSVTKVPSKDCYKKVGEDKEKNLTYTETSQMSCVVLGNWDSRVDMADGTVMVPSNGWECKRTPCKEALKNSAVTFQTDRGDVYVGSDGAFETSSRCGSRERTSTLVNTTITPKVSCRGWASVNGREWKGKRDVWSALKTSVTAGKIGVSGELADDTSSWIFDAFRGDIDGVEEEGEEGEEEESDDVQEDLDLEWTWKEKSTVSTVTSSIVVVVIVAVVLVWRRQQKEDRREEITYVHYNREDSGDVKINDAKTTDGGEEEEDEGEEMARVGEEVLLSRELNSISRLTEGILQAGEGMTMMLNHIERMAEDLETGTGEREEWQLANKASDDVTTFSSGDQL